MSATGNNLSRAEVWGLAVWILAVAVSFIVLLASCAHRPPCDRSREMVAWTECMFRLGSSRFCAQVAADLHCPEDLR